MAKKAKRAITVKRTCPRLDRIAELVAVWARRLVEESRAGALREAAELWRDHDEAVDVAMWLEALAAEAEPGAPESRWNRTNEEASPDYNGGAQP